MLQEEQQFARTLEQGLQLLHDQFQMLTGKEIPGDMAFKLYDTYGFPIDLTVDIAKENGFVVDTDGFEKKMQRQRSQSQAQHQFNQDYSNLISISSESVFEGYERNDVFSSIVDILVDGKRINTLSLGMKGALNLHKTPFYAESGGQVGDQGEIKTNENVFKVLDTKKQAKAIIHYGEMITGTLSVGDEVEAQIDDRKRAQTRLNHTATHLLHAALKQVLGDKVQQKGSLVEPLRARFDFSYSKALTKEQIREVEALINRIIRDNVEIKTSLMDLNKAKESGAVALFGEKYDQQVRVLTVGSFSKELCGGTHAKRTGDIGLAKLLMSLALLPVFDALKF